MQIFKQIHKLITRIQLDNITGDPLSYFCQLVQLSLSDRSSDITGKLMKRVMKGGGGGLVLVWETATLINTYRISQLFHASGTTVL